MKRIPIIGCVLFVAAMSAADAQNPVFSQYYSSGLYLNPALAGLEKDTYFGMNYRTQWSNLSLPFSTFQFSYIQPITKPGTRKKHWGGLGLSFLNDVAGTNKEFTTNGLAISFAYDLHLNRFGNNVISLALQGGASQQRINYNSMRWSSQYSSFTGYDESLPGETGLVSDNMFHPVFNAGMMWYYTNKQRNLSHYSTAIYNGVAVYNLVRSNGFYLNKKADASLLYKVHGGFISTWSRKVDISPNYLIQYQEKSLQVNVGMYAGYTVTNNGPSSRSGNVKVNLGAWYRLQDAIILSGGLSNAIWNVAFSYDSNVFSLSKTFGYGSSFEVSLSYKVLNKHGFKRFSSPLI